LPIMFMRKRPCFRSISCFRPQPVLSLRPNNKTNYSRVSPAYNNVVAADPYGIHDFSAPAFSTAPLPVMNFKDLPVQGLAKKNTGNKYRYRVKICSNAASVPVAVPVQFKNHIYIRYRVPGTCRQPQYRLTVRYFDYMGWSQFSNNAWALNLQFIKEGISIPHILSKPPFCTIEIISIWKSKKKTEKNSSEMPLKNNILDAFN